MRNLKGIAFFLLCLFVTHYAHAQEKTISGTVTDENNVPLPNVDIGVMGKTIGTNTNFEGEYELDVEVSDQITFSYVGYKDQQITVTDDQDTYDVSLEVTENIMDEVVVVGYGDQERRRLTSSVATIDAEVLESRPITDVGRGLQGVSPGLTITTPSGQIGENPTIKLRGTVGTLGTGGGAEPLILVDNVEVTSLQDVNPEDIKDISVLKDAASTSIYGSRGAWGVILITTKSGKRNEAPTITYSNNFSWNTPTVTPKVAPAAEGAEMAFGALQRANPSTNKFGVVGMSIDQEAIEKMRDWEDQYGEQNLGIDMEEGRDFEIRDGGLFFYRPWDPRKLFVKQWSPQQKHDISVSGGSEKTNYHLGLGYLHQGGVYKTNPDKYERYNVNLSVNTSVRDWLDVRGKILNTNSVKTDPHNFGSATYDAWYYTTRWPAMYPYGKYEGESFRNHVSEVEQANMDRSKRNLTRMNLGTTLTPIEDLEINFDYTFDKVDDHSKAVGGTLYGYDFWSQGADFSYGPYTSSSYDNVTYGSNWSKRHTGKGYMVYDKKIDDNHNFKLTLGGDLEEYEYWAHSSERRELLNPDQGELSLATGDEYVSGGRNKWSTLGFFGRLNYSFKDKFLIELNSRYDGSSRLAADEKWAFFPSGSLGYVISEEDFMEPLKPTLSFLKFRGSWGQVGNQNTALSNIYRLMSPSETSWLINGKKQVTAGTPGALPASLTWETVTTLDFGLDANLFDDKLGITFDWYKRTVSDMHSSGKTLPSTFGAGSPQRNYGEMETAGWEIALDFNHNFSNGLNLSVEASLTDFKEKITKFANETKTITSNYEGKNLGEIWGYETDRLFTEDDFNDDGSYKDGIPNQDIYETNGWFHYGPGDVKYKDLNEDGVIDYGSRTVDDPGDMKVIGNSTPRYQYGLNIALDWKGIDLSMFLQGVGKRDLWPSGPVVVPGYNPAEAWFDHQLDYWTEDNPDAFYPRLTNQGQSNDAMNFLPQTKYLLDMSYLRMKNITLGYSFSKSITEKLMLNNLRVYISGENLFETTGLDIPIDPEVDYTTAGANDANTFGRVYPFKRSFSFGLQVSL